jgi:hypothetical protein
LILARKQGLRTSPLAPWIWASINVHHIQYTMLIIAPSLHGKMKNQQNKLKDHLNVTT